MLHERKGIKCKSILALHITGSNPVLTTNSNSHFFPTASDLTFTAY
jgi:hypothetical protein